MDLELGYLSRNPDYSDHFAYDSRFLRPTRSSIRRTFFGETDSRSATRETFRPSRSQILGMINSANSSLSCWKVLSPTDPCDHALSVGLTSPRRSTLLFKLCRSSQAFS